MFLMLIADKLLIVFVYYMLQKKKTALTPVSIEIFHHGMSF